MDNFENQNNFGESEAFSGTDGNSENTPYNNPDSNLENIPEPEANGGFSAADDFFAGDRGVEINPPVEDEPMKIETRFDGEDNSKKPKSKGLRVFAGILALILVFTVSATVFYNLGKKKATQQPLFRKTAMKVYPKPANTDEMTAQEVYDKINDSVVGIIAYSEDGTASQASGVVYTDNEYILTNDHIYATVPSAKFKVFTSAGEMFDADYVAGDTISDLALLKVKNAKGLKAPQFGDSEQVQFGENVVAVGRPGDARSPSSISTGIVSNPCRRAQITTNYTVRMIQTDCDIFEGSSGGALVNMYGQVIGITSSKMSSDGGTSMGFAIPVKTVARVAPQLSSKGKVVDRAKLGISYTEISELEAELNNSDYTGLYITEVSDDSDLAGKVEKGSIITHINGTEIKHSQTVLDIIDDSYANDTIKLTIVDPKGNSKEYSVKLKANIGESSYSTEKKEIETIPPGESGNGENDKEFNFPKGE